ncbi:hypothetical protein MKJ04_00060 [Pontibacter sp. E15-1]|uniref:DUF6503 family protein n=1 Tax=Pontibacter sp. E15-1 TaxID=2919918 RepID=UPI001F4F67A3|nr:DUF6503 family protein [Pontibacter sp. E15-1]MCJ8163214.1 hypothetical protein [Pontibacter sp. E15-1]
MKLIYLALATLLVTACQPAEDNAAHTTEANAQEYPSYFKEVLDAHGGLEKWKQFGSMQYQITKKGETETHLIDLKNRKDLVKADKYTIGYDGHQVWVSPNKAAFPDQSATFYHNLYFYFHAMPFVLADPGVNYEKLDTISVQGKTYNVIGISFGSGVGETPEDQYQLFIDPATNRMAWLLYTITYFDKKQSDEFKALKFEDYKENQGLLFPTKLTSYKYENGQIGDLRYGFTFDGLALKKEQPDQAQFEKPENAEVDSGE